MTSQGCLSPDTGTRAGAAQLDNRRKRSGLRLRSLPDADQARELDCAVSALGFSGRVESTVLPPEATPLRPTVIIDDEVTAKRTAEGPHPPALPRSTDGSRTDSEAVGYAVSWQWGELWSAKTADPNPPFQSPPHPTASALPFYQSPWLCCTIAEPRRLDGYQCLTGYAGERLAILQQNSNSPTPPRAGLSNRGLRLSEVLEPVAYMHMPICSHATGWPIWGCILVGAVSSTGDAGVGPPATATHPPPRDLRNL